MSADPTLYEIAANHFRRSGRFSEHAIDAHGHKKEEVVGYSWRSACARCELPPHMKSTRILILLITNLLFVAVLWTGVIYKAIDDSTEDYLEHFTNWMWTFAAIYYTLDVVSLIMSTRFFEFTLLWGLWWMYSANVWVVFWLVFVMVYDNPGVLTDEFKENGGDYYAGTVLVADKVFHILPAVYTFFYFTFRIPDFIDILELAMTPIDRMSRLSAKLSQINITFSVTIYILMLISISCAPVLIYYNSFDINEVYEADTNPWLGVVIIFSTIVVTIVAPVALLSPLGKASQSTNIDTWTTHYTASARDYKEYHRDSSNRVNMRRKTAIDNLPLAVASADARRQ